MAASIPERRDSHASSSHEPSLEPTPTRSVELGKHCVYTHFPKDRNCEICQRTKITRAPCRRRIRGAVPRAEHFGDLITADHKVLVSKLKEKNQATFFSPSENWCLPSPSTLKPEEREFVVDSGASMHMISKKELSDAEMDTLTKSCSPTIVITANGEVQTHEEAIVYVKELDIFLTMKVLEDTPAVFIARKALR